MHWEDFLDAPESFRISFSEHDFVAFLNKFSSILKFESDYTLITAPHAVCTPDLDGLDRLSYAANMKYSLIAILNSRMMM